MSKLFKVLLGQVGLCNHENPMKIGSYLDEDSNVEYFVYSCKECGRVFKSQSLLVKQKVFKNYEISKEGIISFKVENWLGRETILIDDFINGIKSGQINFSRDDLSILMKGLEKFLSVKYISHTNMYNNYVDAVKAYEKEIKLNETLQSIIDNKENIIYNEDDTIIINSNKKELDNTAILFEWLKALLLENEVLIPFQAYKLFHLLLNTLYGYEPMRYKWQWEPKEIEGNKYYLFTIRKIRRTK